MLKKLFSMAMVVLILASIVVLVLATPVLGQTPALTVAFAVQNMGTADATIVVEWYTEEGSLVYTSPGVVVAPGALGNYLASTGLPSSWAGSVVISADQPIAAIANTTDNFSTPRYWGSSEGFSSDQTSTTVSFPFVLRARSGRNSTIGIQNAGSSSASVYVNFIGHASSPINLQVVKVLNAGANTVLDLNAEVAGLGSGWMGSAVVTSTEPLAASSLDIGTDVMYNYSAVPAAANDLVLPFIAGGRSNQDTAHALLNPSSSLTSTVTITYTGDNFGTPNQVVVTQDVGPGEMWNVLHSSHTGAGFLGSAVLNATEPVMGIVNHSYGSFSGTGRKMAYTMVDASELTPNISLPFVLRTRSNKAQGIIIQNTSPTTTTLYVSFTPLAGGGNGNPFTYQRLVGPGQFYNFATFFSEWDPIGEGAFGTMVVTNTAGVDVVAICNTWNTAVSTARDSLGSYIGTNY
jgi:hypothetical protein